MKTFTARRKDSESWSPEAARTFSSILSPISFCVGICGTTRKDAATRTSIIMRMTFPVNISSTWAPAAEGETAGSSASFAFFAFSSSVSFFPPNAVARKMSAPTTLPISRGSLMLRPARDPARAARPARAMIPVSPALDKAASA